MKQDPHQEKVKLPIEEIMEGSVDFKVTAEDSVNLEHTYLCHLVKDNLKWLLGN